MKINELIYRLTDKIIRRLASQKKWREAKLLVNLTKTSHGWLNNHIENCAKASKEYKSYFETENISDRLLSLGFKHLSSKIIKGGVVNFGIRVHKVYDLKNQNEIKILEKVYGMHHSAEIDHEKFLFENIDEKDIAAPKFFGYYKFNSLISFFYEYIEGIKLTPLDLKIYKYEVIKKHWTVEPNDKIKGSNIENDILKLLERKESLTKMREISLTETDELIIERLEKNVSEIVKEFKSLPSIIVHQDIKPGNVIKSKQGAFYIIDWDKWCVSNVGAGLIINPEELFNSILIKMVISFSSYNKSIPAIKILKNVCIYNLAYNLKIQNYKNALKWAYNYFSLTETNWFFSDEIK